MNNKYYFEFSQQNEDEILDISKPEGVLVINRNSSEQKTELMEKNKKLIELITTYKTIRDIPSNNESVKVSIIKEIINILENTSFINYSPFCVYLQVLGYSFSAFYANKKLLNETEKINLINCFVNLYIDNRHDMYSFHGYSNQVLQVNSDAASSRRKGKIGIDKMLSFIKPLNFLKAQNINDLKKFDFCYLLPDKGDKDIFIQFLEINNIKFQFRKKRQNKNPDMFLKIKNNYYIIEHKLTCGSGGSQNAELNEIIDFINHSENLNNWHYVSCLQGNFFNKLREGNLEPKIKSQYNNILEYLKSNPSNYFLNGKGLEKLINDLVEENKNESINICLL